MALHKIITKLVNINIDEHVGKYGDIFYDPDACALKMSDGTTVGGVNVSQTAIMGDVKTTTTRMSFGRDEVGPPLAGVSGGDRLVLWDLSDQERYSYAIGIDSNTMWYSIDTALPCWSHLWYAGGEELMKLQGNGQLTVHGPIIRYGSNFIIGTSNKQWQFTNEGNIQLPASGDILDSNGNSVLLDIDAPDDDSNLTSIDSVSKKVFNAVIQNLSNQISSLMQIIIDNSLNIDLDGGSYDSVLDTGFGEFDINDLILDANGGSYPNINKTDLDGGEYFSG